ncbi:hypothetical protein ACI1US_01832 [Leucobacter sp. BZR 635]
MNTQTCSADPDPAGPDPAGPDPADPGHPWLRTTLWSKVWRVALCVLFVWIIWVIVNALVLGQGRADYFFPSLGYAAFVLAAPPLGCAALAAVTQRVLTEYVPFTQSLLFGAMSYAAGLALVILTLLFVPGAAAGDGWGQLMFLAVVLLPAVLVAGLGYGLALATVTERGPRVLRWVLGVSGFLLAGVVVALVAQGIGA